MSFLFRTQKTLRRLGNAHRDKGEWTLAAEAYRGHLAETPADAAIWVQLGHVEKEAGHLDAAQAAYEQAATAAPLDPDPLLHLAHMLKSQARFDDSFTAFLRLLRVTPEQTVLDELNQLMPKRRVGATVVAGRGTILFSMQDLFGHLQAHAAMSGIQRVQAGIVLAAMADPNLDCHFILHGPAGSEESATFVRLDPGALREIIDYVGSDSVNPVVLKQLLMVAEIGAAPITFGAATTVVLLGAFWALGESAHRYVEAKREGVRLVLFVHDVIPATHPQYCDGNLSHAFWRSLAEMLHIVDFVMTNSDFTRTELTRLIAEYGARQVPIETVPLAHSMGSLKTAATGASWPASLAALKGSRFVAYVSTIEGRKNHIYIVRAWQRMIANGVSVPDLVFVGRMGWRVDELSDLLKETGNLGGRIHIVHGLSDAELNAVYAKAMFTVFASLIEGWGLPVGESLVHGVPCVASGTASIPEVGGNFVDYLDPTDLDDGVRVLTRMIEDDRYRAERRRAIRDEFVPRSWRDVGDDLLAKLHMMIAAHPDVRPATPVALGDGSVFRPGSSFGQTGPVGAYFRNPLGLAMAAAFYEAEPAGAWLRGRSGELTFSSSVPPGEDIVLLLAIKAAPWAIDRSVSIDMPGRGAGPARWKRLSTERTLLRIRGTVSPDGTATLMLRYSDEPAPVPGDTRRFAIALSAIGYAPADDPAARAELRETFLFR